MNDPTAQHLQPIILIEYLQLKGGISEGEEIVFPTHLHISKEGNRQAR